MLHQVDTGCAFTVQMPKVKSLPGAGALAAALRDAAPLWGGSECAARATAPLLTPGAAPPAAPFAALLDASPGALLVAAADAPLSLLAAALHGRAGAADMEDIERENRFTTNMRSCSKLSDRFQTSNDCPHVQPGALM